MLYLKRKSDGKEFPVYKYECLVDANQEIYVIGESGYTVSIPSDEYELIFKPLKTLRKITLRHRVETNKNKTL